MLNCYVLLFWVRYLAWHNFALDLTRQSFWKGSLSHTWAQNSKLTETKKVQEAKSKIKSMLIAFFEIKGTARKEFVLASQFCILLWLLRWLCENMRRLHSKLWWQKNWLLHQDNTLSHTSFLTREILTKTRLSSPYLPYSPDSSFMCLMYHSSTWTSLTSLLELPSLSPSFPLK
jgi:hypothetical protein